MDRQQKSQMMVFMMERGYFDLGGEITTAADVMLGMLAKKGGRSRAPNHMSVTFFGERFDTGLSMLDDIAYTVLSETDEDMKKISYPVYLSYYTLLAFESVFDKLSKHRQMEILSDMVEEGLCFD